VVDRKSNLFVGLLLVGCAREVPSERPATEPPLFGHSCALSTAPQVPESPPRVFVELATLQGDIATVQPANVAAGAGPARPQTFSQLLAEHPWEAVSVRNVIARDGVRQTFPWDSSPKGASTGCPAGDGWELHMTPRVKVGSPPPLMVHVEVQILPGPPPGVTPNEWAVPAECGARTTVVVSNQQLVVLTGFPQPERGELLTTLTPYVIWRDSDLQRLAECKRNGHDMNVGVDSKDPSPTHSDREQ
jgi:hypothetical protein